MSAPAMIAAAREAMIAECREVFGPKAADQLRKQITTPILRVVKGGK